MARPHRPDEEREVVTIMALAAQPAPTFLLQRVQPAMTGLIDGSLSTPEPLSVALGGAIIAGVSSALGSA